MPRGLAAALRRTPSRAAAVRRPSDQSSPTSAFVKLKCALPPRFFTDYLCLLKIDGRWQIVQKVFATEVRD